MAVRKNEVFLISGQLLERMDGTQQLAPEVEQRVVVAPNDRVAYRFLSEQEPAFRPIGFATLQQFEESAAKLRATIQGKETGWKLLVAPGMVG